MPKTAARVTQADIARLVRGLKAGGVTNVRAVIRDDGIYLEADTGVEVGRDQRLAQRTKVIAL